jgi:hypothetical protein
MIFFHVVSLNLHSYCYDMFMLERFDGLRSLWYDSYVCESYVYENYIGQKICL